ncbi:M42 family metallopeptidase [Methanothermobacter sp. KEPCO-1]|uniref:Predicted M42 aminopeptidase n=1 Tax=Methanothermobacter marburgensis (strain ATCC BAA-927 / DSM 2133 / JCM 14651 / NBRC 100331 / OCM 82 / Marburg) TaxID=79929 RepID=D9PW29_METTM|nr:MULTISPECIES: M42 family metallopeptidase [Methanothermobacter]ADL58427.1 predicted M42 aminopeptidase [Methanothermobacter marburgensis str. Marburg]QEF93716.1 M42 family metallopeptidase [Methanothermobacter sp. KEPCO-1]WBF10567.1 M42 family metallopeptidase [Methanothermobacter marburgensis]
MKELMKRLSLASGVSGFEGEVRDIIASELEGHVDKIEEDRLGNIIATRSGSGPSVMLAAHMDEIGLMVRHIDKKGFIRFSKIGGISDQMILNQAVWIHGENGPVMGVIGSKPPHRMKAAERKKVTTHDNMFIDIGAESREDAEELVSVGDPITFHAPYSELPNSRFTGKALDNRIGCLVMVEVLKRVDTDATVYGVGTVQEEVGLKGAKTSAFKLNPDMALALDVTIAGDHPGMKEEEAPAKLDGGPAVILTDASGRGIITHPRVKDWLLETAGEEDIPVQIEVSEGGTTDATAIHLTREGIPAGVVSVPTRYIHTTVSMASMKDIEMTVDLLVKAIERL